MKIKGVDKDITIITAEGSFTVKPKPFGAIREKQG
jgi:hypothetical protein